MASLVLHLEVYDQDRAAKEGRFGEAGFNFYGCSEVQRDIMLKLLESSHRKISEWDISQTEDKYDDSQNRDSTTDLERKWREAEQEVKRSMDE